MDYMEWRFNDGAAKTLKNYERIVIETLVHDTELDRAGFTFYYTVGALSPFNWTVTIEYYDEHVGAVGVGGSSLEAVENLYTNCTYKTNHDVVLSLYGEGIKENLIFSHREKFGGEDDTL